MRFARGSSLKWSDSVTVTRIQASKGWGQRRRLPMRRLAVTCREVVDFLSEYRDGSLAESVRARFEEHLSECPDCVAYMATYVQAVRLGKVASLEDEKAGPA